jgi:hypothetical protein
MRQRPPRNPIDELLKYAIAATSMCLIMLIVMRGKWLMALLIAIWAGFVLLRIKRKSKDRQ